MLVPSDALPADFLATHPELPTEGVVPLLYEWLAAQGRLLPPEEAMCGIQVGGLKAATAAS